MISHLESTRVWLAAGYTDMRKSINGLGLLVEGAMNLNPFSGNLFVFCNRGKNIIKILYWHRNGFCLWQKRLECQRFKWPERKEDVKEIDFRELLWLLDGLEISALKPHKTLNFSSLL